MRRPSQPRRIIEEAIRLYNSKNTNRSSVKDVVKLTSVPKATLYVEIRKKTCKQPRIIVPRYEWLNHLFTLMSFTKIDALLKDCAGLFNKDLCNNILFHSFSCYLS